MLDTLAGSGGEVSVAQMCMGVYLRI